MWLKGKGYSKNIKLIERLQVGSQSSVREAMQTGKELMLYMQ